jgi:hypothetical protein
MGVVIVAAALAGVGLLAWGALRSDDSGNTSAAAVFDDLRLPAPLTPPTLTREQALVEASQHSGGDVRAVDVQVSTMTAVAQAEGDVPFPNPDDRTRWLVRIRGLGTSGVPGLGLPAPRAGDSVAPADSTTTCVEAYAYFPDVAETDPGWSMASGSGLPRPDSACNVQLTDDAAIVLANIALSGDLQSRLPERVQVVHLPLADAVARLHDRGVATTLHPDQGGDPVWLVVMTGYFFGAASPTPVPETPRPTTAAACRIAMAIVSTDGVLAAGSAPSTDC